MITSTPTPREGKREPLSTDLAGASDLLERDELLKRLDRAVTKRLTIISAPPGSGKTSLLRAWADRSTEPHRVACVSVDRDQRNAQRFWTAVLGAIRGPAPWMDSEIGDDRAVERVLSEVV